MFKTLALFLILLSTSVQGQTTPPKWQSIIDYPSKTSKAYIDINSRKIEDPVENFRSGTLLVVLNVAKEIEVEGKKLQLKSMARRVIASCNMEIVSYVFDLYYDVEFPDANTKAIYLIEYKPSDKNIIPLKKSTPMYSAVCPEYI